MQTAPIIRQNSPFIPCIYVADGDMVASWQRPAQPRQVRSNGVFGSDGRDPYKLHTVSSPNAVHDPV